MSDFSSRKGTILVVDQDTHALLNVSSLCQSMGYMTLTAQGEREAIRYIENCSDQIDMLLIDPQIDGVQNIEPISRLRTISPSTPVVIVSPLQYNRTTLDTLGVKAHVQKPYSLGHLNECIQALLEKKSLTEDRVDLEEGTEISAKIMLVDDEKDACEVINEILYEYVPQANFTVKWAQSGDEAIQLSKEFEPDIAIVDMRMPGMSGDELIQRLKKGEGYCPREFVIYTGVCEPQVIADAQQSGHQVISKPADLDTLFEVLKRICLRHHLLKKKNN